ncbi:MAG: hypothetical protein ACTSQ8_24225 [Candidatus Helarchaeota archaeon]
MNQALQSAVNAKECDLEEVIEFEFNDFLQKEWYKDNQEVLDDDIADRFDEWLNNLDVQEVIDFVPQFITENFIPSK